MNQDDRTRTTSWDAQTVQQGATKRDKSVREAAAAPKKKKKKQPWVLTLILVLCCSLLSGAMGVGGVLLMQHLQAEEATEIPEHDISYIMHIGCDFCKLYGSFIITKGA